MVFEIGDKAGEFRDVLVSVQGLHPDTVTPSSPDPVSSYRSPSVVSSIFFSFHFLGGVLLSYPTSPPPTTTPSSSIPLSLDCPLNSPGKSPSTLFVPGQPSTLGFSPCPSLYALCSLIAHSSHSFATLQGCSQLPYH